MRVLLVNQYFPPDASATAYLLGELAEDLSQDHEVWVVAGRPSYSPEASVYRPVGVRVQRAWSTSFRRVGMARRISNYGTFLVSALVKIWRLPHPDVVVGLTDPPVIGLVALMAARRHRSPFVYVCWDIFPDVGIALGRLDNPVTVWFWRRLNRSLRGHARRVVAIGRDMLEKLQSEGVPPNKLTLIPNWANNQSVDSERVAALRESTGWQGKFVVMHAGNIGLAQNLGILLEAAARLRNEAGIVIAFLGDGAAKQNLQDEAERRGLKNVVFIPYQPKRQAQTLMAVADLHIVSLAPGLKGCAVPSKIYGIMAAGKPFIAAVEQGSESALIAEEHGCGIRVEPDDAHALAEAILRARDLPLEQMGSRGREAFERFYDRPIATEAYRKLLESVAG
jgi:colanic acid biosynthesis glycosyl transferase WcaI